MRRLQRQRLLVGLDRAGRVVEVLLQQRAAPELQLGDRRHVGRQIDLGQQRRRQLLPAPEPLIEAVQRRQRLQLGGILLQDRLVELDRLLGLSDLLFVEAGQLEADLQLLGLRLGQLQLLVVDRQQVGEPPGGDVEALERADRLGSLGAISRIVWLRAMAASGLASSFS